MIAERHGRPTWSRPSPYGYPESVQASGMVVAPLLAGFTIALIGLVVDTSNNGIRHRDTALLVLTAAVAALITAIQCASSARRYVVIPDEIEAWWPGVQNRADAGEARQARELRAEQLAHHLLHERWASRSRIAYHVGILLVLAGMAVVLVPPPSKGTDITIVRWSAIALAGAAALGEAVWIAATSLSHWQRPRRGARTLAAVARWVVPSYEPRLRDARAVLALQRLAETVARADVKHRLCELLLEAAEQYKRGSDRTARARLRCFKQLLDFEERRASSGVGPQRGRAWSAAVDEVLRGGKG